MYFFILLHVVHLHSIVASDNNQFSAASFFFLHVLLSHFNTTAQLWGYFYVFVSSTAFHLQIIWFLMNFYDNKTRVLQCKITRSLFFTPLCSSAPCYYTQLFNLHRIIHCLTPFVWLRFIKLTTTYSSIFWERNLWFSIFYLRSLFRNTTRA
jgi:hypothetical protein